MFFKNVLDDNNLIKEIYESGKLRRYTLFIIGVCMQALAFNIFILPSNMVFGVSGMSVIVNRLMSIDPAYFILLVNLLLILVSLLSLGKGVTKYTVLGAILYPVLIEITKTVPSYMDLGTTEPVIIALTGAALYGLGTGLVFRGGYTTGGTDVLKQIVSKYGKKSVGQATLYVEGIIVTLGIFVFGWQSFIYSVISLGIISAITDKIMLGVSEYKSFQIISGKGKEIKQFILKQLMHGVTVIDSRNNITEPHRYILFCTVPTKEYFVLKEAVRRIDKDAIIIVTDTYEVDNID